MTTSSIVAAGLGAASPSLLRLAIGLETGDVLPERTYLVGLAIFVLLGCIVGWLFDERDLKKAFYTGIGLPALLQLGISEIVQDAPVPVTGPAGASAASMSDTASAVVFERSAPEAVLRLTSAPRVLPRRLFIVVGSGRPDWIRVEFSDRVGARIVREPNAANDRILTFDVPERATMFRVVVRGSFAEARTLRTDPTDSFRVEVAAKPWSGLKRAIGADDAAAYVVSVQPLRGSPGVS